MKTLTGEKGMITTEFLILSPVLILLLYVAFSINRYLEQRQVLSIASRNIALQVDPVGNLSSSDFNRARESLARHSLALDLYSSHGKVQYNDERTKLMSASDGYGLSVKRVEEPYGHGSGQTNPDRHSSHPGKDAFTRNLVNPLGHVIAIVNRMIDTILGAGFDVSGDRFVLFFEDNPSVGRTFITIPGDAGLFERGIHALVQSTGGDIETEKLRTTHYQATYHRVQAGFHPTSYRSQGMVGWLLGLVRPNGADWANASEFDFPWYESFANGLPDHFTTHCMNNYRGGDDCVNPSWFTKVMDIAALIKAIICAIADIFGGSCTSMTTIANELGEELADEIIEDVVKSIENELKRQGERIVRDQIKNKKQQLRNRIKQETANLRNQAADRFMENLPLD